MKKGVDVVAVDQTAVFHMRRMPGRGNQIEKEEIRSFRAEIKSVGMGIDRDPKGRLRVKFVREVLRTVIVSQFFRHFFEVPFSKIGYCNYLWNILT